MKKLVVALVLCFSAVLAKADSIVIPFSGSGAYGRISSGGSWIVNHDGSLSWGSPGVARPVLPWIGSVGDITDLSITFMGLPDGVVIDDVATACGDVVRTGGVLSGGASSGTALCTGTSGGALENLWTPTISADGSTITFDAPAGVTLGPGESYYVNVFFSGNEGGTVDFTGGWSSPVPEPGTVWLLGAGLAALGDVVRRRRSR